MAALRRPGRAIHGRGRPRRGWTLVGNQRRNPRPSSTASTRIYYPPQGGLSMPATMFGRHRAAAQRAWMIARTGQATVRAGHPDRRRSTSSRGYGIPRCKFPLEARGPCACAPGSPPRRVDPKRQTDKRAPPETFPRLPRRGRRRKTKFALLSAGPLGRGAAKRYRSPHVPGADPCRSRDGPRRLVPVEHRISESAPGFGAAFGPSPSVDRERIQEACRETAWSSPSKELLAFGRRYYEATFPNQPVQRLRFSSAGKPISAACVPADRSIVGHRRPGGRPARTP